MIVADAALAIACARIGRLPLLRQVVAALVVPEAVYDDLAPYSPIGIGGLAFCPILRQIFLLTSLNAAFIIHVRL